MGIRIIFIFTIFFSSCQNPPENFQNDFDPDKKYFQPFEFKTVEIPVSPNCFHDPLIVITDDEGYAVPSLISANDFPSPGWIIPFNFPPDSILAHLFPGVTYHNGCYSKENQDLFTCWKCPSYPIRKRSYPAIEEFISFPNRAQNESRWLDTISWTQPDGKRYFLFSVSTSSRVTDACPGSGGRFIPGWLGLAIFTAQSSGWQLIAFDPAADLSGQYDSADRPEILITGFSSFLIRANDHDAGAGSPRWNMLTLFVLRNKKFVPVTAKMNTGVGGRVTEWKTEIHSADSLSKSVFPDLWMISSGSLYSEDMGVVGENCLVPEAASYFKIKNAFLFERKQLLRFTNGKYLVKKTEFTADTSWTPEN